MSSPLVEQSEKYREVADELLASFKLPEILSKYGRVTFVGSYAANLMMHGDIDIHILRDRPFDKAETLKIFNDLVASTKFNSYYIGDWNGSNLHPEFPYGYYIGLKIALNGDNWKIDMWFVDEEEQQRFNDANFDITKVTLTPGQREAILALKKHRNNNGIKISGQKIYESVVKDGMRTVEAFEKAFWENASNPRR